MIAVFVVALVVTGSALCENPPPDLHQITSSEMPALSKEINADSLTDSSVDTDVDSSLDTDVDSSPESYPQPGKY